MDDTTLYATAVMFLVAMGILAFATYRAFKIRRALAQPVYRNRALSLALMAVLYILALAADLWSFVLPNPQYTDFATAVWITILFNLPYFVFAFFMFASVDETILVAIDMDLLQRNTFQWKRLRFLLYALALIVIATILISNPFLYQNCTPDWANTAFSLL